jgi:uncharacterized protein (TIGR02996 family)
MNPMLPAVLAHPEDDTVRLICADWLEEHGDADRAQFIRAQCELARLPTWDRRRQELTWLAEGLQARHGGRWRSELPALEGIGWAKFERGFVSTVWSSELAALYRHGAAIAAAAPVHRVELPPRAEMHNPRPQGSLPWLRALRFTGHWGHPATRSLLRGVSELEIVDCPPQGSLAELLSHMDHAALTSLMVEGEHTVGQTFARALAGAAWARRLTRLELGTRFIDYNSGYFEDPTIGTEGAGALAGSPHLRGLKVLNLGRQNIQTAGFNHVLTSATLSELQELDLRSNQIGNVASVGLSGGAEISRLDLGDNPIGDIGASALAEAPRLASLACLSLDTCEVGVGGVQALTAGAFWPNLCRLDLSRNPLGARGLWPMAEADAPARLHTLNLSDCDLNASAGEVLAVVPWLTKVQCLDLSRNSLEEASQLVLNSLAGGAVRALSLAGTRLGGNAVGALAPLWTKLVFLDLSDTYLGSSLAALAATSPAHDLQSLWLRNSHLTPGGLASLLEPGACPNLHTLVLARNTPEPASLQALVDSALFGQLRQLDLSGCGLNDRTAQRLAETPALAGLERLDLCHNAMQEQGLVALAQSPYLANVREVKLSGNSWTFSEASRRLLDARFGPGWYYNEEDEQEQAENEDNAF